MVVAKTGATPGALKSETGNLRAATNTRVQKSQTHASKNFGHECRTQRTCPPTLVILWRPQRCPEEPTRFRLRANSPRRNIEVDSKVFFRGRRQWPQAARMYHFLDLGSRSSGSGVFVIRGFPAWFPAWYPGLAVQIYGYGIGFEGRRPVWGSESIILDSRIVHFGYELDSSWLASKY